MNITADVIVELYTKYNMLNYWNYFGAILMLVFGAFSFVALIIILFEDFIDGWKIVISVIIFLIFIAGTIIFCRANYLIEVVLKPEIAKYVVPAGLDIADKVSKEMSEMWGILKGVLTK
jgi:hypothetical protein